MHHAFKATAGAKVECLFFSHTNKFPVLFECILIQKVVSNSCFSNNPFLNYSKKTHKKTHTQSGRDPLLLIVLSAASLTMTSLEA